MPEYPDITIYLEALEARNLGQPLNRIRLNSPFLLRSVDPSPRDAEGRTVTALYRLGKRIVFELEGEIFLVLHLMIAGRLKWQDAGAILKGKQALAAFDFPEGSLVFTEAGSRKRASLFIVQGRLELSEHDPGGLEVLDVDHSTFQARLLARNHTLKRALTDPRLFSGIGNAYSDEILHRAKLSPLRWSQKLDVPESKRLYQAIRNVLSDWTEQLRELNGSGFPKKVTAFRDGMAVRGRAGEPCPECGTTVQRIAYPNNETNYCLACQTGGKILADRSLSRLLKKDWPKTLEELEELKEKQARSRAVSGAAEA
ncbi:MAG TPA: formamidopyrimidine-DNA glycosylase [Sneathiellales bacterium]|nr:formamidopyrimidine-DNA glycosylase [Sneathiellales bacterium]